MQIQPRIIRLWAVIGAALLGMVLAGCVVAAFSLPAGEVGHSSATEMLNDEEPDVVVYNNVRYVVFAGEETSGGDYELFIRGFDLNNNPVTPLTRLTNNSGSDYSARIASGENGFLYVAWAYVLGGNRTVWWLKVRASDLAIVAGPRLLSGGVFPSLDNVQIAYSPFYSTTAVVWASGNPTLTIYYNRVVTDTNVGTPLIVSQGTGCAGAAFHQYEPRMTRTYPAGSYTQIAWIGHKVAGGSDDGVYWREVENQTGTFSSNCLEPSSATFGSGREYDVEISTNRFTTKSFVTWAREVGPSEWDVIMRPINARTGALCSPYLVSNSNPAVYEYYPSIGAGRVVSDWVHLAWESGGAANAINYELLDASNCAATPVSVSGVLTLSTAPLTSTDDVDKPQLSVYPDLSSSALNLNAATLTAEQLQFLTATGQVRPEQAQAALADGTITAQEAYAMAFGPRPNAQAAALPAPPAGEDSGVAAPPEFNVPDCAARPEDDKCQAAARRLSAGAGVSPQATCGPNTVDHVAVSFLDDTNDRMYGWLFAAGDVDIGLGCGTGAYLLGGRFAYLARQDTTLADYGDSYRSLVDPLGFATFVWAGLDSGAPANDEVYLVTSKIPVFLPVVRR